MEFEVVSSKREMGTSLQSPEPLALCVRSVRCVIRVDCFLRCILTKTGSDSRVFHDLQTHLIRIRDFTSTNVKTSTISSSWRITRSAAALGWGGIFMRTMRLWKLKPYRCWCTYAVVLCFNLLSLDINLQLTCSNRLCLIHFSFVYRQEAYNLLFNHIRKRF